MDEPNMLQVVLMGLITVFVVLVCLILIIKLMGIVMEKFAGKKAASAAVPTAVVPAAPAAQPGPADKRQLVAAIACAIAEEMGEDVDHIRIHSIRRL